MITYKNVNSTCVTSSVFVQNTLKWFESWIGASLGFFKIHTKIQWDLNLKQINNRVSNLICPLHQGMDYINTHWLPIEIWIKIECLALELPIYLFIYLFIRTYTFGTVAHRCVHTTIIHIVILYTHDQAFPSWGW